MNNNYALITGASQGLGKYLALDLAQRNYHILLVALPNENLETLALEIKKLHVKVEFFETDLTKKENILALVDWANSFSVEVLINNAGCGGSKYINEASFDYMDTIIQLNVRATSLITKLLIPNLTKQPKSYILNISSMAAFSPIGFKTVYPASKKFIEYFSQGLQEELKSQNVTVSVVYPGPMKTNAEVSNRIEKQSKFVNSGVVALKDVAKISLDGLFQGKNRIIPGKLNKFSRYILAILPLKTKVKLLSKAVKKEIDATK
ncbi:SDR family NAD(P)-dependent oxidoreductase [Polaribacter sp.]|uniref:SDR family NAD(P)-dependent oxidoreductase n=1 Tax=Polaribacter sp. TaxID=1920175 RepID=UPI003F6C0947